MKRVGNLWDSLTSTETAYRAIVLGTENKRCSYEVRRRFGYQDADPLHIGVLNPDKCRKEAEKFRGFLLKGWRPSPLTTRHISPPGQKARDLGIPTLNDHIIGWMIIETIRPIIQHGMYEHSYGSIPGRGIDAARKTVERWVQHDKKSKYFVKLDIHRFYANIDHDIIMERFRRVIKDDKVLEVIAKAVNMAPKGVPIGAYPSQWFGNFYLTVLDHYITQQLYKTRRGKRTNYARHYLRYMDDMLLIGSSKSDLAKAIRAISKYCQNELKLEIKHCWEIKKLDEYPVDIIGYRFYQDHTEMRGNIFLHTARLARKIRKNLEERNEVLVQDARGMIALHSWCEKSDCKFFMKKYIIGTVNIKFMMEVISYADKNQLVGNAACVYCNTGGQQGNYHILHGHSRGSVHWRKPVVHTLRGNCVDDYTQLDFWTFIPD